MEVRLTKNISFPTSHILPLKGGVGLLWPQKVLVREVGPRDGLQNLSTFIPTAKKIELVRTLAKAGVTAIEATSLVNPKAVPQMADAEQVLAGLEDMSPGVKFSALVGNVRGMERAVASGVPEVMVVVSASEAHNRANLNMSVKQSLSGLLEICTRANDRGVRVRGAVATAFGCPYEGEITPGQCKKVIEVMLKAGITEITLADTAGLGNPRQVYNLMLDLARCYPQVIWALHFHDTRGMGLANAVMGIQAGVTILESSLGGLGGCPFIPGAAGNIATEDLVYMLHQMGIDTGIKMEVILRCSMMMENILGKPLPARVKEMKQLNGI